MISIIIPVYNVENYMQTCVDSVLKQTYGDIEILLIDDGSTDGSGKLCDLYECKDSRIKVFHKSNGGLSDARNFGINRSRGEYITFVDSDDVIDTHYIEILLGLINECSVDISICNATHCYEGQVVEFKKASNVEILTSEDAIKAMLYQKKFLVSACAKLYKRELFENIKFPVGKLYEDSAVMYLLLEKCKRVAFANAKIYGYYHREDSITTQKFSARNFDILDISQVIYNHYKDNDVLKRAAISYYVVAAMRIYLNCPNNKEYQNKINETKNIINKFGFSVIKDRNARSKTRLGLACYFFARPFIRVIYGKVNRWN